MAVFKKTVLFLLKIAIAVLMIYFLINRHYDSFKNSISNFKVLYLIPGVAILFFEMFFAAARWYSLLKISKVDLKWREALSLTMRGYFCSLILPGGAIGGDVAKIGMIAHGKQKGERFEPGLSILIDRMIGMIALFIPALILCVLDWKTLLEIDLTSVGISRENNVYLLVIFMLFCGAGICAAAAIFFYRILEKIPFLKLLFDFGDRLTKGLVNRMKLAIDLYNGQRGTVILWIFGSVFFVHLIQVFILFFICIGLGVEINSMLTLTAAIIIGNIAGLIPLTPGGIGLRDITILAVLQAGGFAAAPTIPIIMSMALVIANLLSGVFFFDRGLARKKNEPESVTESVEI